MALDALQSGMQNLAQAGEAGRRDSDSMAGPLNGAMGDFSGALGDLTNMPGVSSADAAKLQRAMRGISAAQSKVNKVVTTYNRASRVATEVSQRVTAMNEQVGKLKQAVNAVTGKTSPTKSDIQSTAALGEGATPAPAAVPPFPHLLIATPHGGGQPFYFNLDTLAFNELMRQSDYKWVGQERLTRRAAQQAVGLGDEKMTLKGAVFPQWRGGLGQLEALRALAARLVPLDLVTGAGHVLGAWCLRSIQEDQSALLRGGIPRKQGFSLEFVRYGDDVQNH
ncbi:phage tail protein [Pseudomonas sp. B392_1p]|uniref:phage tail protein n=1 Tax=Pseudomonas sp. B392_1p TaxID=3457507 RepID=UPI003FCFF7DC